MYSYEQKGDRNKQKNSNLESRCFCYIIWAKSPKIAPKNHHSIAIFSIFYRYGIFYMVRGESSCPDGSECEWQRGVEGALRPSYGRPKLTLVLRFVATQWRCHKKLTLCYFWSNCFGTNRTWAPTLGLQVLFVSKRSEQK